MSSAHAGHHKDYSWLTSETAAKHTLSQIVKHFDATERGVKGELTRLGLEECLVSLPCPATHPGRRRCREPSHTSRVPSRLASAASVASVRSVLFTVRWGLTSMSRTGLAQSEGSLGSKRRVI